MTISEKADFLRTMQTYYTAHGRFALPWRQPEPDGQFDPYKILVSEIMLQQTQVIRVIPKYQEFLAQFPNVKSLAASSLGEVIRAWSGLGYNRRAKYLHEAARQIMANFGGQVPNDNTKLVKLAGVGKHTAGAVLAYAFNKPALFIETNIRTAIIHHFFADRSGVADTEIQEVLEQVLDRSHPREFYWALMDYGSFLKSKIGNLNKLSKSYTRQSAFHGSRRQIRGAVLKALATLPSTEQELSRHIQDERLPSVLHELLAEGLIQVRGEEYRL